MFQSRLVEVAGTPFLNQKDPLDNGDPGMIARIKIRVPGFNDAHFPSEKEEVRRNAKINEVALAITSLYGHHFTRVEVRDMRKQTARVSTRREFEEIYAGQTIFTAMALFPELSRQFASMLVN